MTDRELNEEMARLCGIPTYTWEEACRTGADVARPLIFGGILRVGAVFEDQRWNPIGSWGQVYDFVIPALWRMGLSTCVHYEEDSFFARIQPFCRSWEVVVDTQEDKPSPRFVCLAAVEAMEKLEADDAQ